jgi:CBS domain-containing protein
VRSIMTWPVLVTSPDAPLSSAVATMRDRRVGALIVVEGRRVLGILTETDLLRRIVAAEPAAHGIEAAVADVVVSYP